MEENHTSKSKEDLLIKIRELEKEVKKLNNQIINDDRYGLNWIDVPEGFDQETEDKIPILEEVKDKAITNDDGKPTHILIEGDNYHALTCLNYTHKGKVDVIYIDPPYNTGNDGFTYKDKRFLKEYPNGQPVPKEHPLRHSYWLSFMSKRLKLAKELLSEKGIIFISIDDNEAAQLKLLCNSILGENNFVAQMIWRGGKRNAAKWISTSHEYMFVYAKSIKYCDEHNISWKESKKGLSEIYSISKKFVDESNNDYVLASQKLKQWYKLLPEDNYSKANEHYCWIDSNGVYFASDISRGGGGGPKWDITNPNTGNVVSVPSRGWAYSVYENLITDINNGLIHFNGDGVPCKKRYLKNNEKQLVETVFYKDRRGSSKRLRNLMNEDLFPFPKDEYILKDKFDAFADSSAIILDFFAGSGTTMHSTMKLNEEDGGKRQCILVQENESDICEKICYERNKRVMQGYSNKNGEEIEGLGNSMKYYRTTFVGKHSAKNSTDDDRVELSHKAGYLLALGENTLEEKNKTGYFQIFDSKDKATAIYFKEDLSSFDEFVKEVEEMGKRTAVYIFSWDNAQSFEYNFEHLKEIEIKSIPQAILEIYKSIND